MNIKINKRLEKIAQLVEEDSNVIDVGCDHALLCIYLAQTKKNIRVIASDINEGPLNSAKENIKKYNLEKNIKIKLGNGIETIEHETDTIIISGMGGLNMIGILKYTPNKYKNVNTIILSPNNDTEKVRKEICKLGFIIEDESLVKVNKFIYPIIIFKRGRKRYKRRDYIYGPILISKKEPLFIEYMQTQKEIKEKLLSILPKKYWQRSLELKRELKEINKLS